MIAQTLQYKDQFLEIVYDECPESPREWDNLGVMACQYPNHSFGDDQITDGNNWIDHLITKDLTEKDLAVCLPLYVYDHSGISMKCGDRVFPFNDQWDSSMIGFVYVTKEKLKEEYKVKRISKKILIKAEEILKSEIETYSDYIEGNVYGFSLYKKIKCDLDEDHRENIDSCYGFFGSDFNTNGIKDHIDNFEKFEEV